jgi:hypothetical protein
VVGSLVVVGWAVWRRAGTVRTTLPGLTAAHSLARRRALPPLPFLQVLPTLAHDLARPRWLAQLVARNADKPPASCVVRDS